MGNSCTSSDSALRDSTSSASASCHPNASNAPAPRRWPNRHDSLTLLDVKVDLDDSSSRPHSSTPRATNSRRPSAAAGGVPRLRRANSTSSLYVSDSYDNLNHNTISHIALHLHQLMVSHSKRSPPSPSVQLPSEAIKLQLSLLQMQAIHNRHLHRLNLEARGSYNSSKKPNKPMRFKLTDLGFQAVPTVKEVTQFLNHMVEEVQLELGCVLVAMQYLRQLLAAYPAFQLQPSNWHNTLMGCLLLASKVYDDCAMKNSDVSSVCDGLFPLQDLNRTEVALLVLLDHRLTLSPSELMTCFFSIRPSEVVAQDSRLLKRTQERAYREPDLKALCNVQSLLSPPSPMDSLSISSGGDDIVITPSPALSLASTTLPTSTSSTSLQSLSPVAMRRAVSLPSEHQPAAPTVILS